MNSEEIAAVLDEPQLKRLGGAILALDLGYVAAVQEAPAAIRALAARVQELEALLGEWLQVPFFERHEDWQTWVRHFRPRVEAALGPTRRDAS